MGAIIDNIKRSIGYTGLFIVVMILFTLLGSLTGVLLGYLISYTPFLNQLIVDGINAFGFNIQISTIPAIFTVIFTLIGIVVGYKYNTQEPASQAPELMLEPEELQELLSASQQGDQKTTPRKDPMVA